MSEDCCLQTPFSCHMSHAPVPAQYTPLTHTLLLKHTAHPTPLIMYLTKLTTLFSSCRLFSHTCPIPHTCSSHSHLILHTINHSRVVPLTLIILLSHYHSLLARITFLTIITQHYRSHNTYIYTRPILFSLPMTSKFPSLNTSFPDLLSSHPHSKHPSYSPSDIFFHPSFLHRVLHLPSILLLLSLLSISIPSFATSFSSYSSHSSQSHLHSSATSFSSFPFHSHSLLLPLRSPAHSFTPVQLLLCIQRPGDGREIYRTVKNDRAGNIYLYANSHSIAGFWRANFFALPFFFCDEGEPYD